MDSIPENNNENGLDGIVAVKRKSSQVDYGLKRRKSSTSRKRRRSKKAINEEVVEVKQEYEVEEILSHLVESDPSPNSIYQQHAYLVKWKGWDSQHNTWEHLYNMDNCYETLATYHESLYKIGKVDSTSHVMQFKENVLNNLSLEKINALAARLLRPGRGECYPEVNENELIEKVNVFLRLPVWARDPAVENELKESYELLEFLRRRARQLAILVQWQQEMNAVTKNGAQLTVENEVDLDGRPSDFQYINECVQLGTSDDMITLNAVLTCKCTDCTNGNCECANRDNAKFGYTSEGLIKAPQGAPIYECTQQCGCGIDCKNKVLQKGRTVPLCIFKTSTGIGWGVKAITPIRKGQFITEYVGDLITKEESDKRNLRYAKERSAYLFDLDFNGLNDCKYTIDATYCGNESHFINHSCNPNLEVRAVYADCIDATLPRLGLYARKDIQPGDEINFDYLCQTIERTEKRGNESG